MACLFFICFCELDYTLSELLEQPGIYQDFVNIRKNAAGWSLA